MSLTGAICIWLPSYAGGIQPVFLRLTWIH